MKPLSLMTFLVINMQSAISNQQSAENSPETQNPKPETKIIGLTGGIGSGKSTVAQIIEGLNFPVYYSDVRAKEIVNDDEFLKQKIMELLGSEAYDENGLYNRKFVAEQIFENDELREKLNSVIHPAVKFDFENWVENQNSEYVFKETALLFELNLHKNCYKSILVTADDNIRLKRVMDRDGKTYREVETIMNKQMPEKDKIKLADFILYNNGSVQELEEQTRMLLVNFLPDKNFEI